MGMNLERMARSWPQFMKENIAEQPSSEDSVEEDAGQLPRSAAMRNVEMDGDLPDLSGGASPSRSVVDPNLMMQLEMLRMIKRMTKR
eukprot:1624567-Karenia_brevis.AAC.1